MAAERLVLPPIFHALEQCLHTRNSDDAMDIEKRLFNARAEIKRCRNYCYALINDDLDTALSRLQCIVTAERQRTLRYLPEISEEMNQARG